MPWKRRRSWTGDAFSRQDADHSFMDICQQEIDFPLVQFPNNDELNADAAPSQPRNPRQEIIFAHCPHMLQPCLRGTLLCRADWLCLRGTVSCECAILPIRERLLPTLVQRLRTRQPHGAAVPAGTGTSEVDRSGETTSSVQTLCNSSLGSYSRSLSSLSVRISLAHPSEETFCTKRTCSLSQRNRVRHLAGPDKSQLLIAWCGQTDLFIEVECTSHLSFAETSTFAGTAFRSSSP